MPESPPIVSLPQRAGNGRPVVVVADRHPVVRWALTMLLEAGGDLKVAAAPDLPSALESAEALHAQLLVLDAALLPAGPLPTYPPAVVLGSGEHPGFAEKAMRAGASAYVIKDNADSELLTQVHHLLHTPHAA